MRNKQINKISLSGLAGSGKSTVGKLLAEKLGWKFISVGEFSRELAMQKFRMDINEFQNYCKENPEMDKFIDEHFKNYIQDTPKLIVDYRLAYHFIKDCFHVYLDVSENVAIHRICNGQGRASELQKYENKVQVIKERNKHMRQRFIELYQTDFLDINNYNLIVQVDHIPPLQVIEIILNKFNDLCIF